MPITSLDTTNLTFVCPFDATVDVIALATLEAGSDYSPGVVSFTMTCGHTHNMVRSYRNTTVQAGAVNGLHAYLVSQAQINANQSAYLTTEATAQKPSYTETISATAITPVESDISPGKHERSADALAKLMTPSAVQALLRQPNALLFSGSDGDITAIVAEYFSSSADKSEVADNLKALRDREIIS